MIPVHSKTAATNDLPSFHDQDFGVVMDGTALLEEELALCLSADDPPVGLLGGILAAVCSIGTPRIGNTKPG